MPIAQQWFELTIRVPAALAEQAAAIAQMAADGGLSIEDYSDLEAGAWEIAHVDLIDQALLDKPRDIVHIRLYYAGDLRRAQAAAFLEARLKEADIPHEFLFDCLRESDWSEQWKQYFKCTPVGRRLYVCPSWEPCPPVSDRIVLRVDPGAAFGTGTHASTKLCLKLLEKEIKPSMRVLDVGTGSGILSVAAAKLGAAQVIGVDIDPVAVRVAGENAAENGVCDRVEFRQGNLADVVAGRFDLIVANIVADVILSLTPSLTALLEADGGVFICAGLLTSNAARVQNDLEQRGYRVRAHVLEDWVALVCRSNNSLEEPYVTV